MAKEERVKLVTSFKHYEFKNGNEKYAIGFDLDALQEAVEEAATDGKKMFDVFVNYVDKDGNSYDYPVAYGNFREADQKKPKGGGAPKKSGSTARTKKADSVSKAEATKMVDDAFDNDVINSDEYRERRKLLTKKCYSEAVKGL